MVRRKKVVNMLTVRVSEIGRRGLCNWLPTNARLREIDLLLLWLKWSCRKSWVWRSPMLLGKEEGYRVSYTGIISLVDTNWYFERPGSIHLKSLLVSAASLLPSVAFLPQPSLTRSSSHVSATWLFSSSKICLINDPHHGARRVTCYLTARTQASCLYLGSITRRCEVERL